MKSLIRNITTIICVISLTIALIGCVDSRSAPDSVVRGFVRAMGHGNSDLAIEYVCTSGVTVLPNLTFNWQRDSYEIVSSNDKVALIRMIGESRITERDWMQWGRQIGIALPPLISMRINLDFTWQVEKIGNSWCITEAGIADFFSYFVEMLQEEMF
jgi:hypothetical protein